MLIQMTGSKNYFYVVASSLKRRASYKLLLIASCVLSTPQLKKAPIKKNLLAGGVTGILLLPS
jgi:hypothetical protein